MPKQLSCVLERVTGSTNHAPKGPDPWYNSAFWSSRISEREPGPPNSKTPYSLGFVGSATSNRATFKPVVRPSSVADFPNPRSLLGPAGCCKEGNGWVSESRGRVGAMWNEYGNNSMKFMILYGTWHYTVSNSSPYHAEIYQPRIRRNAESRE